MISDGCIRTLDKLGFKYQRHCQRQNGLVNIKQLMKSDWTKLYLTKQKTNIRYIRVVNHEKRLRSFIRNKLF